MNYLTNYYKNLSEQLQNKVNNLQKVLNEVVSPVQVEPGQGAGTLEGDPNYRFIKGVESVGDSARPQFAAWNPNSKAWRTAFYSFGTQGQPANNWASFMNAMFQNWNNNAWWNGRMADFMFALFGDQNYQTLPNGDYVFSEQMKQTAWNCIQGMTQAGSNSNNPDAARAAAATLMRQYQQQYGINTRPPNWWLETEFSPFFTNYYLPGITQFPPTPPWQWNSSMGLPFPGAPTVPVI
jgi:hypothetical protein